VFLCAFWSTKKKKTKKQRNKETKKQRNKETKKQRNKETRKQRNKETRKQRNKETKKTRKFWPARISFLGTAASLLFVTPGAPKQNKKQKLLFIVSFQTDRKKRFSFRETFKRARPKKFATPKKDDERPTPEAQVRA
jgi:hypothetical protein